MEWREDDWVGFYFDGQLVSQFGDNAAVAQMRQMYLILNYAVGGWPGRPNTTEWPAGHTDEMKVDWVRVWKQAGTRTTNWAYAGTSELVQWDTAGNWSNGSPNLGGVTANFGTVAFAASQRLSSLSVASGATAALTPGGGKVLVTGPLTIAGAAGAWTGKVNLADNAMAIDWPAGGSSPIRTVADQVRSGHAGGAWTGNGITSSHADARTYAVGFGESAAVLGSNGGTFFGRQIDGSTVLVRRTLYGDANLDGAVDGSDFARLAASFGRSGVLWPAGDFNYDGSVDGGDFALLAGSFGKSVPGTSGLFHDADWMALEAFGGEIGVAVPEPAAAGTFAALLAYALLPRRRANRRQAKHQPPHDAPSHNGR